MFGIKTKNNKIDKMLRFILYIYIQYTIYNKYTMIMHTLFSEIPRDILHNILEYDGRIKYKKGDYTNIISKNDERYSLLHSAIIKKIEIMKYTDIDGKNFYFEFEFRGDSKYNMGLCYDYNWSRINQFEICFYKFDFDNTDNWKQIRTYL